MLALFLGATLFIQYAPSVEGAKIAAEVADAQRLLSAVDHCSLKGIPSLEQLLRRYERRPELELRVLAAQARYRAGDTLRFRGHEEEAARWLTSVVRRYGREPDVRFQRIVARANLMLGETGHNATRAEEYLHRISRYRETDDLELLTIYADSLFRLSDLRKAAGRPAEAASLYGTASALYDNRIIPRTPPPDPNAAICV